MLPPRALTLALAASLALGAGGARPAAARPAPEGTSDLPPEEEAAPASSPDADTDAPADEEPAAPSGEVAGATLTAPDVARWGIGARLRWVFVPKGMIELFLADVPSGVGSPGFGLEAVRRKGQFEMAFGLEYESLSPDDGYFREKGGGDDPASVTARTDFTEFDGFGWITLDATFVFHKELAPRFALRYGAGLGLGILLGEVRQTDALCTSDDVQEDCRIDPGALQVDEVADTPPVFPVVNLLVGGQYRVNDDVSINLEIGLRTIFYAGLGGAYYF